MMQENPPIDVAKNNSFRLFRNDSFGKVRTVIIGDEPYFVGKDVAEALGYSNQTKAVITHVDERDRLLQKFHDGGQVRSMTVINESGLYALVLSSHKEDAKDFKYWITSEVLPEIRRSGTYTVKRRYPYNNYGPGKQYSNYPARYGSNTETILNAVAETLSKIRINIDVNVHYPDNQPKIEQKSQDNPVYDERIKMLEDKLDKLIDALGGVEEKNEIKDEQPTNLPETTNSNGVKYYSPTYIAQQLGLVTVSGNPHAVLVSGVARLLGIRTSGAESYCDGLVKIFPFTIVNNSNECSNGYYTMFSDEAIDMIIDKLNEIWNESYKEEFYKINYLNHHKGDFKCSYIRVGKTRYHLGKRYIDKTKPMKNEKVKSVG